jgi:3-oxoacyl-[acyl-carrier protein] reductase
VTSSIHGGLVSQRLTRRRALVTGGSRGIGAQIVRRLAADGAAVAFTFRAEGEQAERVVADVNAHGGTAVAVQADSARHDEVRHAVEYTLSQLGRLDILVNDAGIAQVCPVDSFPLEQYDRMMAVNVRAAFLAVQAAVPHLGSGGRIITIPGLSVYSATKAAVAGLTRGLARALSPRAITVNLIQPGPIDTDMNSKGR